MLDFLLAHWIPFGILLNIVIVLVIVLLLFRPKDEAPRMPDESFEEMMNSPGMREALRRIEGANLRRIEEAKRNFKNQDISED